MKLLHRMLLWWAIATLLLLAVRIVLAQASSAMRNQCSPAMVEWKTDSLSVTSFGCVDFRPDTLVIIPHIVNGEAKDGLLIPKKLIKSITLLKPVQSAEMKPRA